eukprot:1007703-Alexandrium_andersonii.AAC.1
MWRPGATVRRRPLPVWAPVPTALSLTTRCARSKQPLTAPAFGDALPRTSGPPAPLRAHTPLRA